MNDKEKSNGLLKLLTLQQRRDGVTGLFRWGRSFDSLNAAAAAKVAAALHQLAAGNFSNVKGVGAGVFERKVDFGLGYRVYFGKDGDTLVILLGGSSKQRQRDAVTAARERWGDYRRRKR